MKKIYHEAEEFLHIHKTALLINACVCLICYGHLVFSQIVGIDTEHVINYPGVTMQWESIGRQGLLVTKRLFGILEYNPYLGSVLFLGSFILLGSSIAFLCWIVSGKDDHYPYGWFAVLFSTCPVWMIQFYFSLQRAEVVMGMLYGVISVFSLCEILFLKQRKVYWFVLCLFFGVWCLASYQSCVLLYIGLCITCYLLDFFRDSERAWQVYAKHILGLITGFGIVYFAYNQAISRSLANSYYLDAQIKWGEYPVTQSISLILDHIKCTLNWYMESDVSAFPLACICILLLFCIYTYIKKKNFFMLLPGLLGLMFSPFLFSIYIGDKAIARTQFALPLACAAACMLFWGMCNKTADKKLIWTKRGSMTVAAIMIWICISLILRLEYTEDIRYREDSIVAQTIATDLGRIEEAKGVPVIFVGERKARLNGAAQPADIYGYSFFQWDHSVGNPTGATWRITGFMKALGLEVEYNGKYRNKAIKIAEDMPCYPQEGYISVQKKFVVIKLSDTQTPSGSNP